MLIVRTELEGPPPVGVLLRAFNLGGCFLTCVARGADLEKDNILPDRHYTIVDVVRVRTQAVEGWQSWRVHQQQEAMVNPFHLLLHVFGGFDCRRWRS